MGGFDVRSNRQVPYQKPFPAGLYRQAVNGRGRGSLIGENKGFTMQVTETLNSGLKREIKITVPAGDMEAKLMARLSDARNKVRINGFRPGKVPVQHLRKVYGKSFMAEVVNEILNRFDPFDHHRARRKGRHAARSDHDRGRERGREDPGRRRRLRVPPQLRGHPGDRDQGFLRHQGDAPGVRRSGHRDRRAGQARRRIGTQLRAEDRQGRRGRPRHASTMSARSAARPSLAAPATTSRWCSAPRNSSRASRTS